MPHRAVRTPIQIPETLTDRVLDEIRKQIGGGQLAPDEVYSVYQLADQLGVSRTPVREALIRLAEAGLVKFERNRGFRVIPLTAGDLAEIFALRILLEVPATRKLAHTHNQPSVDEILTRARNMRALVSGSDIDAYLKEDQAFHNAILRHAGNQRQAKIVWGLHEATHLSDTSTLSAGRSLEQISDEHQIIADKIERGEPDGAANAMQSHLLNTGHLLILHRLGGPAHTTEAAAAWQGALDPQTLTSCPWLAADSPQGQVSA